MRACNCVLAMRGYCCQDGPPARGYLTTTNSVFAVSNRRHVRKIAPNLPKPWLVTGLPMGAMSFATWREAMDWALSPMVLMN